MPGENGRQSHAQSMTVRAVVVSAPPRRLVLILEVFGTTSPAEFAAAAGPDHEPGQGLECGGLEIGTGELVPTFKRDAKLDLAVNASTGPATWSVTQATDQTDYASSDEVATVAAASNGVGRATFDLTVLPSSRTRSERSPHATTRRL